MTTALISKKKITSEDTAEEVIACYEGKKWAKEINELFPITRLGCINFGYWEHIPDSISLKLREKSQLDLYNKLFEFVKIDEKSGSTILEVGCGRGHGVNLLSIKGHDSYGVDLVEAQIQKCIQNYPNLRLRFKDGLSNKTGFKTHSFDFVISVEAAQHFHSFFSFVREGHRVLRNNGKIAITTFFFPNKHCKKKIKNFIPEDISGTHRTIPIHNAEDFLKKAGFQNIEIISIGSKVFHGFCKWAAQSMSKKNHTPKWIDAYEKGLLDYYIIKAIKK
jgi:cyclopropane fatty-acyl-phospholipid synthase-like methyltransferase